MKTIYLVIDDNAYTDEPPEIYSAYLTQEAATIAAHRYNADVKEVHLFHDDQLPTLAQRWSASASIREDGAENQPRKPCFDYVVIPAGESPAHKPTAIETQAASIIGKRALISFQLRVSGQPDEVTAQRVIDEWFDAKRAEIAEVQR